jgi:hypothetical protein
MNAVYILRTYLDLPVYLSVFKLAHIEALHADSGEVV